MDLPIQSGEHLCQNPPLLNADLLPEKGDRYHQQQKQYTD
jgi:hypothetical protein